MHKTIIRFAELKDIDILVDMQVAFEEFFQNIAADTYPISREDRKKDITELNFSQNPLLRTLIAEANGEIVGRISFYKGYTAEVPPYYNFHLSGMYVLPKFRGMKIAATLFEALRDIAKKENIKIIKWTVWGKNEPGMRFYEKIGGKRYAETCNEHYMFLEI